MAKKIHVEPLGWLARLLDTLMVPVMYLLAGTLSEVPQRTHRWNNTKLSMRAIGALSSELFLTYTGDSGAIGRKHVFDFRFHARVLGGWSQYVVLRPTEEAINWHIGWCTPSETAVSRIELRGPVRMLLGPGAVQFFGVDARTCEQLELIEVGRGMVGDRGHYTQVPLL